MERKVVNSELKEVIGEYGVMKIHEKTVWDNGKVFGSKIIYDVCLEHGDGDIVASFDKLRDAIKWAKEN
jgi:hypothetical protein